MKRFMLMLVAIAAMGLVFGCSKKEEGAAEGAEGAAKTAEPMKEEAKEPAKEEMKEEATEEEKEEEGEGGAVTTGVQECDDLIESYMKCDKLPQQSRDAFLQGADAWKKSIEAGGDAAKDALKQSCTQAAEASKQALSAVGC